MDVLFSFDPASFERLFPFYFLLDSQLHLISCGKTIAQMLPGACGQPFRDHFTLIRPATENPGFDDLGAPGNHLIILECRTSPQKITLRGQFERLPCGNRLLFIGSPWFGTMEQLVDSGLSTDDFALHDPTVDLLHLIKTHEITISDMKKMLQAISTQKSEESARTQEVFLANMNHEIRTPLNAIIGMIREMSREPMTPKQSLHIQNAALASQHLLSIANDILDLTKIESGQLQLEHRAFSLPLLIDSVISIMEPGAEEKKLTLTKQISPGLSPAYMGDANRLKQVLLNLVSNAIKFTEMGEITVECTLLESAGTTHRLMLTITDTGIGMDAAFIEHMFDKFTQGEITTARKYGGTGLGLAITRELVRLMQGTTRVSSKKGQGTVFEIILTLETTVTTEIEAFTPLENFAPLKNREILLVEDNDLGRFVAHNTLSHYGILVTEATNGAEAVGILRTKAFDLVLMDLHMPVMDGLTATDCIRRDLHLETPIIALTANAFKAEMDRCIEAGMNDYITKPFEESVLLGAILRNLRKAASSPGAVIRPQPAREKLYSLEYFEQFSRGNADFIRKLIGIFIEQMPDAVREIREALDQGDLVRVGEVAHRIKPNIDHFGIFALKQDIRSIISMAREGEHSVRLEVLVIRLDEVITEVVADLANETI